MLQEFVPGNWQYLSNLRDHLCFVLVLLVGASPARKNCLRGSQTEKGVGTLAYFIIQIERY